MFKSKTLKQVVFLTLMCLSAVLLCFVGVYAVSTYNLKSYSYAGPDIFCKLEFKEGSSTNFSSGATVVFDNHTENDTTYKTLLNNIELSSGSVANTLTFRLTNYTSSKHIRLSLTNVKLTTTSGDSTSSVNYAYETLTPICCDKSTNTSNPNTSTQEWTITSKIISSSTYTLSFNIVVEEVHKITVSGTGLSNSGTSYYFTSTETPEIALTPLLGYQLPQSVTSSNSSCSTYSITNNSSGTATFSSITDDQTLTCNCEKVFTIYENGASSMFSNGTASQTYTSSSIPSFLPNNGCYTSSTSGDNITFTKNQVTTDVYLSLGQTFTSSNYTGYVSHTQIAGIYWQNTNSAVRVDNSPSYYNLNSANNTDYDATNALQQGVTYTTYTGTNIPKYYYKGTSDYIEISYSELCNKYSVTTTASSNTFKEYKYYIEMGYYPQSLEYSFASTSLSVGSVGDTIDNYTKEGNYYYKTENNVKTYYVCSAIKVHSNSVGLSNLATTDTDSPYLYGMFKLEPIVWTVVGAKTSSGTSQDLDSLYYSNNMLYTDVACGKPFTGQLELLSAYGLDATTFNDSSSSSSYANYSDSKINTLLNSSNTNDFYNYNKIFTNSHLIDLKGNYLKQNIITTYESTTTTGSHYISTSTDNDTSNSPAMFLLSYGKTEQSYAENYAYSDYFKNRNGETAVGSSYSLSVTSLSDFAIARGAENGYRPNATTSTMGQYAVSMGWSSTGSSANQNTSSCAYWLRTASTPSGNNAYLINLNGVTVTTNSADKNICLRPFTVLDLGYYYNSSKQFYETYEVS